ncbi:MAG TPA: RpiB/LacA/LacB family sugar-phosphate isomerase, partial [Gemmatimonadaceae bacterium]
MRLAISGDHAGFELKSELAAKLAQQGHEILDCGTHSTAPTDYPDSAQAVAEVLRDGQVERGIIVCGSGAGVSIAANKFPGIRAAVCHDTYTAHQAVEHDDMNVLCLGSRV